MAVDQDKLRNIKAFPELVKYLRNELNWPIEIGDFEELFFEYDPDELGIDEKSAAKIEEIKQLRPLADGQPWGIFFVKFAPKRLPVVALRRILSTLALKKRTNVKSSERASWQPNDLLFISNYGENDQRHLTFAHFSQGDHAAELPTLKVLGWDDADTVLHIDHVHSTLREKLSWPNNESDLATWQNTWSSAFTLRHREVITTSKDLAVRLAALAKKIRNRASSILSIETQNGPISKLHLAFKESLIHDLSEDDFADMYAQTIAYGLLSARLSNPKGRTADELAIQVPVTNPFLKELMETFLDIGGRKGKAGSSGIDFDELGVSEVVALLNNSDMEAVIRDFGDKNPQEDPVIHFYELFLKEYDAKKRTQRGVFYTPRPVVSYIVRSVDELLRTEFGLEDGLADITTWGEMAERHENLKIPRGVSPSQDFVQILDPATGTGTFLVEAIDLIHKTLVAKWKEQGQNDKIDALWNEYVPKHLLTRLHGYELLMAPYAIAHLKIGLKLYETGYCFGSDERARVYLTNALEPAQDFSGRFEFAIPALAHEALAVNEIKETKRFTVIMGNPPYSINSSNLSESHRAIVNPYKQINGIKIVEKGARQFEKNIQDDYIKFIRIAEVAIKITGAGILSYITNHSYLTNPTFRGLRYSLLKSFQDGTFIDLHGNTLYREAKDGHDSDENVFDIKQGVAICLLRSKTYKADASFSRVDLWGSRAEKYQKLGNRTAQMDNQIVIHPGPDFWVFRAEDKRLREEYQVFPKLSDLMPVNSTGIKTHRDHFALAFDLNVLRERIIKFRDTSISDKEIQKCFDLTDTDAWRLSAKRKSLAAKKDWEAFIAITTHRPFDSKWIYYHPDIIELPRTEVMQNLLPRGNGNLAICFPRNLRESWKYHAFVTRDIVHKDSLSTLDTCYAAPLFIFPKTEFNFSHDSEPNLSKTAREWLRLLGLDGNNLQQLISYFYAILFSPSYSNRYAEFLKIDFPRLPLTSNLNLFCALAKLGGELVALHLMESPKLTKHITKWIGGKNQEVEKVTYSNDTIWIDKAQSDGFRGVPENVWNFHIGGYQVCEKWLKDRKGRTLSEVDIIHYQKIIVALSETIRIMAEIDKVIEKHGGWPGAFKTR